MCYNITYGGGWLYEIMCEGSVKKRPFNRDDNIKNGGDNKRSNLCGK